MKLRSIYKKYSTLNIYIILVLGLIFLSFLYFFYYRQRNQVEVFVSVMLVNKLPDNPVDQNAYIIPRWIGESIKEGDRDASPLSGINAKVLEKKEYDGWSFGKFVSLLLKTKVIKDKAGTYLFKNKPLLVGSIIDLKLTNTQIQGLVTDINEAFPETKKEKLTVELKGEKDAWIADAVKVGSTILGSKGEVEVKIIDKKVSQVTSSGMRYEGSSGKFISTEGMDIKKIEVAVEIITDKIGQDNYYGNLRKIKVNEWLYLPFKEVNLSLPISSVTEAK